MPTTTCRTRAAQRLAAWLAENGRDDYWAADALGLDIIRTRRLLGGLAPITSETADRLSRLTGTDPVLWLDDHPKDHP